MKNIYKLPVYVGIILRKANQILLIQRINSDWASGYWNFPGGSLEQNETLEQAVIRETQEELNVKIEKPELVHVLYVDEKINIIGFYFLSTSWYGEPINNEPHKHSQIGWFDINNLPSDITNHALLAINGIKNKIYYSESILK